MRETKLNLCTYPLDNQQSMDYKYYRLHNFQCILHSKVLLNQFQFIMSDLFLFKSPLRNNFKLESRNLWMRKQIPNQIVQIVCTRNFRIFQPIATYLEESKEIFHFSLMQKKRNKLETQDVNCLNFQRCKIKCSFKLLNDFEI